MVHSNMTLQHTIGYTPCKPLGKDLQLSNIGLLCTRMQFPLEIEKSYGKSSKSRVRASQNCWGLEESKAYSCREAAVNTRPCIRVSKLKTILPVSLGIANKLIASYLMSQNIPHHLHTHTRFISDPESWTDCL